ncbi:MAG: hypothetical protein IPL40_07365 [Proteobacteria bacterium]|nr:hypothetical protein [Pseudomonadota bacterium]
MLPQSADVGYADATCDGIADVTLGSFNRYDFDVDDDGALVLAGCGAGSGSLTVACLRPDGTTLRGPFVAAAESEGEAAITALRVLRARAGTVTMIAWNRINLDWPSAGTDFHNRFLLLDAGCNVVAGPTDLEFDPALASDGIGARSDYPPVAMAADGRTVALNASSSRWRLLTRASDGTAGVAVTIDWPPACGAPSFSDIAIHPLTGEVAVSCASNLGGVGERTLYLRRYDPSLAPQTGWIELATKGNSWRFPRLGFLRSTSDLVSLLETDAPPLQLILAQLSVTGVVSAEVPVAAALLGNGTGRPLYDAAGGLVFVFSGGEVRVAAGPSAVPITRRGAPYRLDGSNTAYTYDLVNGNVRRIAFAY